MKFVFPSRDYEEQAKAFIAEFYEHGSEIHGTGLLDWYLRERSYGAWLDDIRAYADIANPPANWVPSYTYFYLREEDCRIVGMSNVRMTLNDFLRSEGGHIGYCIRPTERGRGYGTRILRDTLAFVRPILAVDILVSCEKTNLASAHVILQNGGILDAEFYSDAFHGVIQRYRIPAVSREEQST